MVACGDVTNDPRMVTPAVVMLHRKPEHCAVKLNKEGYAETELKFGRQMSGWYLGNILVGGIIGFVVDAANGAMWNRTTPANTTKNQAGEISVTLVPASNTTN
ncbi:MAG TPA: hypothetical protein VEK79_25235 [Thermoanaerobaculia bacterium]|nr:hypothetical protein [Thermoanaerobaculia bacterium]